MDDSSQTKGTSVEETKLEDATRGLELRSGDQVVRRIGKSVMGGGRTFGNPRIPGQLDLQRESVKTMGPDRR